MNVKSAFLNNIIQQEVYVKQPPGFKHRVFPNHVLHKALYGLKQAPRAFYKRLSNFQLEKGFSKGKVNTTLFTKRMNNDLLIVQIYINDIVFGTTNHYLCKEFSKLMQGEFEKSMIGELKFFLRLQIKQSKDRIFINQSKYVKNLLKMFEFENLKYNGTLMRVSAKMDTDETGKSIDTKIQEQDMIFIIFNYKKT